MKTPILFICLFACVCAQTRADKLAYSLDSVAEVLSDAHLIEAASRVDDPQILFGLACLANPGSPLRPDLFERVRSLDPLLVPATHIWHFLLQEESQTQARIILEKDPDNALGYYILGKIHYEEDREDQSLLMFRRGAACEAIRMYQPQAAEAIFKAVDHLGIKGRQRLCVLGNLADEINRFSIGYLQHLSSCLTGMAMDEGLERREEIANLLVILSGQLWVLNDYAQSLAESGLSRAFRLKAEAAALQRSPKMNSYAALTQALVSVDVYRFQSDQVSADSGLVHFFPSRINIALGLLDKGQAYGGDRLKLSPEDRAAYEIALGHLRTLSGQFIGMAETQPDALLGPYLRGLAEVPNYEAGPWVANRTEIDRLVNQNKDLFNLAVDLEQASQAMSEAARNDPQRENMRRMMQVGLQLIMYASDHDNNLPRSLNELFDAGLLKPEEARSVFTDELYTYLGNGQERDRKKPEKQILLYDNPGTEGGVIHAVFGDGHGEWMSQERFEEYLKN